MAKKKRIAEGKATSPTIPRGYKSVLTDLKRLIGASRRRALSTVNRELVLLYWQIGAVIVRQQDKAKWGDGVVKQLAIDLPESLKGSLPTIEEIEHELAAAENQPTEETKFVRIRENPK